ncbi:MAG: substrate-binding domain-containing protein [Actinomycetota bacterium]|nr:substrate-binding domain-containing protein [Actinomycetota bacterium]
MLLALAACSSNAAKSPTTPGSTVGSTVSTSGASTDNVAYAKSQLTKYDAGLPVPTIDKIANMPSLKGKTVWYIPFGNSIPILATVGQSINSALSKLGAQEHVCDGNFLPTAVAQCMSQAVSQGAYAVITGFIDYSLVPTAYENLVAHKIPVVVAGEAPSDNRSSDASLAFFDTSSEPKLFEQLQADTAIADSNGKANILDMNLTDSSATQQATAAAKAEVSQHCPGCTFTEADMSTSKLSVVPSAVSAALVSHPNIDYLLVPNDAFVAPIIAGIQSAGRASKVKVISSGGDLAGLQRIKANNFQISDSSNSPVYIGWMFTNALIRLLAGEAPIAGNAGTTKIFSKSNVGTLSLTPAKYGSDDWYIGSDWQKQFLAAWGAQ